MLLRCRYNLQNGCESGRMNIATFLFALFTSSYFQAPEPLPVPPETTIIPAILLIFAFFIIWKYFPRQTRKKSQKS